MITYSQFAAHVEACGLRARDCGGGHWQIQGGFYLVNYYPQKGTVYVSDSKGRGIRGSVEDAILCAQYTPSKQRTSGRMGQGTVKRLKFRLWKRRPVCAYCGSILMSHKGAHLDHYIPLSRGGTNDIENLRLACADCDEAKGDMLPSEFESVGSVGIA